MNGINKEDLFLWFPNLRMVNENSTTKLVEFLNSFDKMPLNEVRIIANSFEKIYANMFEANLNEEFNASLKVFRESV